MEEIKILDMIITINPFSKEPQRFAVLNRMPEYTYERNGDMLTAVDGICCDALYVHHDPFSKAFAGRCFDIKLTTGEVLKATGQVWQTSASKCRAEPVMEVGIGTKERLNKCFVFGHAGILASAVDEFLKTEKAYDDYYGYEKQMKERIEEEQRIDQEENAFHMRGN